MVGSGWGTIDWNEAAYQHRTTIAAAVASVAATTAGFPLDSLKSRLQVKRYASVFDCALQTWRAEGVGGFYRGIAVPMLTITLVRTASITIYSTTKDRLHQNGYFARDVVADKAVSGFLGGATSGVLISAGSCTFELIKIRAQLESIIAAKQGRAFREITTLQGASEIYRQHGIRGFYAGFGLHSLRDTLGTGCYFFLYDSTRFLASRYSDDPTKSFGIPKAMIPFVCGSGCGLTSWLLVYPLDLLKTRVQRDALAGLPRQGAIATFRHLTKGGIRRLYSGLGVSAFRSVVQHGIMWTILEQLKRRIEIQTGHADAPQEEV